MKKLIIILLYLFLTFPALAQNIYVDPGTNESGVTWSRVDGESYTSTDADFPGVGIGYDTVQDALDNMTDSDDIYIRGGTYQEGSLTLTYGIDGTADDYVSVQSYPGEWAILDGVGGSESYTIGYTCYDKNGDNLHNYWKFERLEIKNGPNEGLFISGGPFKIRYNYFHDNTAASGGANPGAIKGMIWHDSIIEYNRFEDNGTSGSPGENGNHIAIHSDYAYETGWDMRLNGLYDSDNCTRKNEIRYNYFIDNDDVANAAYRHKGKQWFTPIVASGSGTTGPTIDNPTMTYDDYGDKIHHNVVINSGIQPDQDFAQIYQNIVVNEGIMVGHYNLWSNAKGVCYNNTLINGTGIAAPYNYTYNPADDTANASAIWIYMYNNIISAASQGNYTNQISVAGNFGYGTIDMDRNDIQKNYIYNPVFDYHTNDTFMIGNDASDSDRSMNAATFDSTYSSTNFETTSGTGLFSSGYITDGEHEVDTGVTIADGGEDISHPYLTGVSIPDYIGATNPDDNTWAGTSGVQDLDVSYFTDAEAGSDPSWIEGSGFLPSNQGCSFSVGITLN